MADKKIKSKPIKSSGKPKAVPKPNHGKKDIENSKATRVPKSHSPQTEKKSNFSNEIKGIIMIACGIFLGIAFLTDTAGAVGASLKNLFYGLLGASSLIGCIFVILTGVGVFLRDESERNLSQFILLASIILTSSILGCLISGDVVFQESSFIPTIVRLFQEGVEGHGGGIIGGGLCKIFVMLLGIPGAWIIAIATEIILIISFTGISLKKILQKFSKKVQSKVHSLENSEEKTVKAEDTKQPKVKKSRFFDEYFNGKETVKDPTETPVRRFEFKEDDELLDQIIPKDTTEEPDENRIFTLDNMKTGILSELPTTKEDGSVEINENPEDEKDFIPPTDAQLEDVFDPLTKKAIDSGLPLDRAVVAGKKMALEDSAEISVEEQLTESSSSPQRIVQYQMPTIDLLDKPKPKSRTREEIKKELEEKANRLLETLHSFKVEASIINITQGPSVTRFELQPGVGVKVSKITSLTDDIALSLAASGVRIEAPIPGKSAVGIEIPNKEASPVPIREVLESEKFAKFPSKTAFALGKDIAGSCVIADIAKFPHVLIAGQTGSGKSVCINSLILSILYKARPDEVKLIMVDPKMVELGIYNGIPHLLIPVVTDPKHAAGALNWAVGEMQNRYTLLKDNNVRNLKGYNALMEEKGEPESKLPEIVIIIDEFADLMIAAKSEVEDAINRLAALARAAGMYLVVATQRPTVNVITGVIKANIPSRIAFNVTSQIDSRTIIDSNGAEKLLGKGDMLYNPSGAPKPMRIQGNFVSDSEIERIIDFIKNQYEADYDETIIENIQREQEKVAANLEGISTDDEDSSHLRSDTNEKDELFFQAVEMILDNGQASVAMFQRRFKIGYQRAARLVDQMEERKIIGPYEGTKPRQVLISRQEFLEMQMNEKN